MFSSSFAPPPPKRVAPPKRFVPSLSPKSAPLHVLPADVLSRILVHTLPRSQHPAAFIKRYKLLNAYSLVCRAFRIASQALLYQHVHLPKPAKAYRFIVSNEPLGAIIGRRARTLRVGAEWEQSTPNFHKHGAVLMPLIANTPFLTEMWIEEATFDPAVLSWAQDLQVLHLREVTLQYPKEIYQWRLPHLHTLYFSSVTVLAKDRTLLASEPLFTSLTLPSLAKLFYTWAPLTTPPNLEIIGPQLTHLYLFRTPSYFPPSPAPRFNHIPPDLFAQLSSLKHLFYDVRFMTEISPLDTLASPIVSLELFYSDRIAKRVEEQLAQLLLPDGLLELEMLFLPPAHEDNITINALRRFVLPKWRENVEEWIQPAEVREVDSARYDGETDEAINAWLRRTHDIVPTERTRPARVAPIETIIIDDDEEGEQEEQNPVEQPIVDGFVDDTDDEEMDEAPRSMEDLLEVLRKDTATSTETFYDAEEDDELDGEAIEIR